MAESDELVLAQVAVIADRVGAPATIEWYREIFGFLPAGGADFGGPELQELQDLPHPDPKLRIEWLVEQNHPFQLEIFDYERPTSRPRPEDWSPVDIGYSGITLTVQDFDDVLAKVRADRSLASGAIGAHGDRRILVLDPNGIHLEVRERDIEVPGESAASRARPEVPVTIRAITLSVPDLADSVAFFRDGFGMVEVAEPLHRSEDRELWGLAAAEFDAAVVAAGGVLLELVQYREPTGRPRPEGRLLSDAGVMNVALSTTSAKLFADRRERLIAAGHEVRDFFPDDLVTVAYVTDRHGFNVELIRMDPAAYPGFGFSPLAPESV
jgi:catechol 2,3-dioxygenase-like lactoylglutathione lyase family enzyme